MSDAGRKWGPIGVDEWVAGASALELRLQGQRVLLVGPCPGCGHQIDRDITAAAGVGLVKGSAPERVSVACNCGRHHAGRAADARPAGCGAAGAIRLEAR
ncbi:transposase [Cellulomonas sp. zg-ZUI222]|uniref:Transposase n=1 Tax=Cellulomonas wangleii TaxID=2816956 RepID=A0ABX8D6I7_9CELL|nr:MULTISPECIES: transposase [Cellulomonas]MBO0901803.1 transposase [Cellulomonas sp. zg-ZUI22]MBO0922042.1 transposase [Cellulomonas wangleii]MBO0926240.1 transposase [Cellulomonas wangleii]QVI62746.1 transposase [Cellulomonas wangleii]